MIKEEVEKERSGRRGGALGEELNRVTSRKSLGRRFVNGRW